MQRMLVVLSILLLVFPARTMALINPSFTPVNLVEGAAVILDLKISPVDAKGLAHAEVVKALKGSSGQAVTLDLSTAANAAAADKLRAAIAVSGDEPVLLLMGKGENSQSSCKLHISGMWYNLDKGTAENSWAVDNIDIHMEATWAGGTDMLLHMVELILANPDMDVPTGCSGKWADPIQLGKVEGTVHGVQVVDLAGKGDQTLFVMAAGGDKLFAYDPQSKTYADRTAALKLRATSQVAAWGDFTGGGRLGLASFDGKALILWAQGADGTFSATPVSHTPAGACVGLSALEVGVKGCAGLVWSGPDGVTLLIPEKGKKGVFQLKPLEAGKDALPVREAAGASLVADFDNDGIADILEPFANGSLFYKGQGHGTFAAGVTCNLALGKGRTHAFLGNFNADGRIDVMTQAEDCLGLWENRGGGKFANVFAVNGRSTAGELSYIPPPKAIGGNMCDLNGDGLQDIFLVYPMVAPESFFNRGFRSFGHAHQPLDLNEAANFPAVMNGVAAGVVADLNGDGAQDMALVLLDGSVCVLHMVPDGVPQVLRVALPIGGETAGPLQVSAESDGRALGTWLVAPGTAEAFIARKDPGTIKLTWGDHQSKSVALENKPVRFEIGDGK